MARPTLYLIDGYAQFFRAYHAIRTPMTSPVTKEPTNMSFGFIGMLLKLLRGEGPVLGGGSGTSPGGGGGGGVVGIKDAYVALALDVSDDRGTFRSQIDPEYKANRPPPPEDLFPQVERCLNALRDMGMPILGCAGFEADDVIATVVERLKHSGADIRIRIISKDKDLKQLLSPPVADGPTIELFDIHTDTIIDAVAWKAESGLEPAQTIDYLALMGDNVDNVPGVEGVGPKTAAQLIAHYGTLQTLLGNAGEVKGKRGEALRAARDAGILERSKALVTLRHDVPIEFELASARSDQLDLARLMPVLKELGFNRYQDELRALMGTAAAAATAPAATPAPTRRRPPADDAAGTLFAASSDHDRNGSEPEPTRRGPIEHHYECITTRAALDALVNELQSAAIFAVDTETTHLSPRLCNLCGISISTAPGRGAYIPVRSPNPGEHLDQTTVLEALRPFLEDPNRPKTGHNLKYDLLVLRQHGVELRGLFPVAGAEEPAAFDSMVGSYLIDASRSSHSLDALALALLNHENITLSELIGSGARQRTFDTVPLPLATEYAAEDADVALQLHDRMRPQLRAMQLDHLLCSIELPLVEVLAELEWNGILIDPAELDRQKALLSRRIAELRDRIDDAAMSSIGRTFNPDSPRQLAAALFNSPLAAEPGLGIKSLKKTKSGHSTDIEVLEKLAGDPAIATPLPALIVEHRQLSKLVGTYLEALKDAINPQTRRIHASFHQTVAVTGRLASSDPNLQNIPIRTEIGREIRKAFLAPPGRCLISADYSQIELRLLAHLSQDPALIQAFHEGQDIHTAVAAQIHGIPHESVTREQRSGAKMVNFGIVYGVTAFGLARRLNIETSAAAEIITSYKRRFAGITTFLEECVAQARRFGYVETMLKRRRPIPDIDSRNPSRRALAERTAINSVVQGSAADLIKIAMVDLHRRLSPHAAAARGGRPAVFADVLMLLQIHDELVFESPIETAEAVQRLIVERMEAAMTLSVPLKADASMAARWFEGS